MESMKNRGRSGRLLEVGNGGFPKVRIPALEGPVQLVVQHLSAGLQQEVGGGGGHAQNREIFESLLIQ
jgi:hypothetical protein